MESNSGVLESELFLQWGNRKRNRYPRSTTTTTTATTTTATTITREDKKKKNNNMSTGIHRSGADTKSLFDNNNHHYTNRRGGGGVGVEITNNDKGKAGHYAWPKLYLGLSDKEKEADFMAMKGCKPPQRPKKRPKAIQKSLLLMCPGVWLSDMYQDRYEIREKKSSKKRTGGLKAMGSLESDSE